MSLKKPNRSPANLDINAEIENRLIEVKLGVGGVRSVRMGLMQLAYALAQRPAADAYLLLSDVTITESRLHQELQSAAAVLRPEMLNRLTVCIEENGQVRGFPRMPDQETRHLLLKVLEKERTHAGQSSRRTDASYVILKILLHHWLTAGTAVTNEWLARTSGYSYPTVANVLRNLGSLVHRESDRSVRLRLFPQEEYVRLVAMSERARSTTRYVDHSGQPRSIESHVRRLERLNLPGIAIGGVLGAKHYFPDLDLVGSPRLDLSCHTRTGHADLGFIEKLDPALKQSDDPHEPANVVVHLVPHADSLFAPREAGLAWADIVECLLDLHEARLEPQASQFLDSLRKNRQPQP